MQPLDDLEVGVMFWAGRDHLADIKALGVRCGQLGIAGSTELNAACVADWKAAIEQEQFTVGTVVAAYNGESYTDIPTVQRTVGFIPAATRQDRERRTLEVSDFARALGVGGIACHIGFVPEDAQDPDYIHVRDLVRRIADHAAGNGQTFALETGQEPAAVLLQFLKDVDRPNVGINFDPANMILYGTGDPIEALGILGPRVLSVHCKDGDWPEPGKPGTLGKECALGAGSVGIGRFLAKLRQIGYQGPLSIEREASDPIRRMNDIESAIAVLASAL